MRGVYDWPKSTGYTVLDTPCREYQGARSWFGYGERHIPRAERTSKTSRIAVHRWVWQQINGPIPGGLFVLHRCDNPPCFRYDHLYLGTQADNWRDVVTRGRINRSGRPKGSAHPKSRLNDQAVRDIRVMHANGLGVPAISVYFGVRDGTTWAALKGITWRHVT